MDLGSIGLVVFWLYVRSIFMKNRFVVGFVFVPWPVREADGCGLRVGPVPGEQGPGEAMEVVERVLLECLFRERRRRVLSSSLSFSFRVGFRTFRVSQLLREPNVVVVVVVETLVECSLLHCLRWTLRLCEFRASSTSFWIRKRFRVFPCFVVVVPLLLVLKIFWVIFKKVGNVVRARSCCR